MKIYRQYSFLERNLGVVIALVLLIVINSYLIIQYLINLN